MPCRPNDRLPQDRRPLAERDADIVPEPPSLVTKR
jgi:hypothetical protein